MLDTVLLGKLAAAFHKNAGRTQQARAGRNVKGDNIKKQLHAAGQPKMNTPGVFAFARGSRA